jgi:hypothetical protein
VEFTGGGKLEEGRQTVRRPGVDVRALPAWGIYARNVERLRFEDVRLSVANEDFRPVIKAEKVHHLTLDNCRFTGSAGVTEPFALTDVEEFILRDQEKSKAP